LFGRPTFSPSGIGKTRGDRGRAVETVQLKGDAVKGTRQRVEHGGGIDRTPCQVDDGKPGPGPPPGTEQSAGPIVAELQPGGFRRVGRGRGDPPEGGAGPHGKYEVRPGA